jgi:hypothetical protein
MPLRTAYSTSSAELCFLDEQVLYSSADPQALMHSKVIGVHPPARKLAVPWHRCIIRGLSRQRGLRTGRICFKTGGKTSHACLDKYGAVLCICRDQHTVLTFHSGN